VILYVLNGVFGRERDPSVYEGLPPVDYYTPSYVALVAATAGILSLPVHLAGYREQGVLRRFRASAIQPATLLGGHMTVAAVMATAGAVLLTLLSMIGYDAVLPESWVGTLAAYAIVIAAFAAMGGLLGLLMPTARAAQGLGVLLFFVFMMIGGAGPPREVLPTSLQYAGDVVPVTHAGRMLREPWLHGGWDLQATAVMVGVLLGCLALTAWRLRAEEAG
jgi:ABC-2 type transport system permease protein